jgi:DNA-binding MarR family transcriptional regulator
MGLTVRRMNAFLAARLAERGLVGIAPSHGDILHILFQEDRVCMSALAERICRDPSTVTALVHKLQRLGYVRIDRSELDRRSNVVVLTEAGRSLEPIVAEDSEEWRTMQRQALSDEQASQLHELLEQLCTAYATEKGTK